MHVKRDLSYNMCGAHINNPSLFVSINDIGLIEVEQGHLF